MDKDLVIETERLILRSYKLEDADSLVIGLNNPNITRWMSYVPSPYTKKDALDFINMSLNNKLYNFAIVLKSNNELIGGLQIRNIDDRNKTASGGIWINEKYQGKGYGKEAFGARIKFAFEVLGLRRLENGFFEGNERSWKMQEGFGYKIEGKRRKKYYNSATNELVDEIITGLLKEEWIK